VEAKKKAEVTNLQDMRASVRGELVEPQIKLFRKLLEGNSWEKFICTYRSALLWSWIV
jgi:hypothetical protein